MGFAVLKRVVVKKAQGAFCNKEENELPVIADGKPTVAAYIYYCIIVIVLWRELNCVKIPQGDANKSANRWGNLRAKGGVVPPSVYT
jgi:hypothetical protein